MDPGFDTTTPINNVLLNYLNLTPAPCRLSNQTKYHANANSNLNHFDHKGLDDQICGNYSTLMMQPPANGVGIHC